MGCRTIALLVSLFCFSLPCHAGLVINELVATTTEEDAAGVSLEWIELYNRGEEAVSLYGFSITDDPLAPRKWLLPPAWIAPGEFFSIWATGYGRYGEEIHANFRLNRQGEYLGIYGPNLEVVDSLYFPEQYRGLSYGRSPDGGDEWVYFTTPTRGAPNASEGFAGYAPTPIFSQPGGLHPQPLLVTLHVDMPNSRIYYTMDGSAPTETESPLYQTPISITETAVVRARAFVEGMLPSEVVTHTYLFRDEAQLPILSLATDPHHLWDRNRGIYANPTRRGREWERPVSVEWITTEGIRAFGVNCGLRIHGGASRTRSPKKSFRLYFRREYGPSRLEYPLFSSTHIQSFNRLVLRGGFNDSWGYDREMQRVTAIHVSDQVARTLHADMGYVVADGTLAELYLNGEYWGLYNPTERFEEVFFQDYYGEYDWDVIAAGEAKSGDIREWAALGAWFQRNDPAHPDSFAEAARRIDLEAFTDYMLINIWLQNYDWPHHNWYATRPRRPDGQWRFYLWDVEYSFGSGIQGYRIDQNTLETATGDTAIGQLFRRLLRNEHYRLSVWNRLHTHLRGALSEENVRQRLDEWVDLARPVIPAEAMTWGRDKTPDDFERAVGLAHRFIDERTPHVLRFMEARLGPPPVSVEDWTMFEPAYR